MANVSSVEEFLALSEDQLVEVYKTYFNEKSEDGGKNIEEDQVGEIINALLAEINFDGEAFDKSELAAKKLEDDGLKGDKMSWDEFIAVFKYFPDCIKDRL